MKKRILSAVLSIILLLSMAASFCLPASADAVKHYFIQSTSDWVKAAKITTSGYWDNTIIHIEKSLDFEGVTVPMFHNGKNFTGVIDGNGFTFSNITMETSDQYLGLVYCLKGTIRNLTLSNCTFTINNNSAKAGAFAASTSGGAVIYKCGANNVSVTADRGDHLGGMIGTCTSGIKMDSCFFKGSVTSNNATGGCASALIGYGGNQARVYNSIAIGTVTGFQTGMVRIHANSFATLAAMPIYNSYCIGMNVANYNGTPADYENAANTVNGHAYTSAGLEANYKAESEGQAAWIVNHNRVDTGLDRVYFTVSSSGALAFGKEKDQAIKLTTVNGNQTTVGYQGTGDEVTLATVEGKTPVAQGGLLEGSLLFVYASDITVTYQDAAAYTTAQLRKALQEKVDAYRQMNPDYFAGWTPIASWIGVATNALQDASTPDETLTKIIADADSLSYTLTAAAPQYFSVSDYPVYRYIKSIKNYSIGSKQEWLDAIEMSDFTKRVDAFDFSGVTLHLTAHIDMENTNMLPLCYNGKFNGDFNGHNFTFKNINITIDSARGPVGLIAWQGNNRKMQNLGLVSGKITLTGNVIHKKSTGLKGNKLGGVFGKSDGTYVRGCWSALDASTESYDNAGGIVGDGRSLNYMDNCYFVGRFPGYGLLGYGGNKTVVTNSFNGGSAVGAVQLHINIGQGNEGNFLKNTYSIGGVLGFNGMSTDSATKKEQQAKLDAYNAQYTVNSAKEGAWRVNQGYQHQNLGDKADAIYTIDAQGNVAYGTKENQIRRITMKCEGRTDEYLYAAAGSILKLNYELDANYYALEGEYSQSYFEKGKLHLGNEDVTVRVYQNVDRGDVNGDGSIGLLDAQLVLRQSVGLTDSVGLGNGDVNFDGALGADDAALLARTFLGDSSGTVALGKPQTEGWIKVCSYNIKVMHYEADTNSTLPANQMGYKMEEIAATLKEIDADIVGLQEVDYMNSRTGNIDQVKWLAEKLGYPYYHFTSTTGDYGTAVMSRFPILKSEDRYFAGNVRENGCRLDGYEPRGYSRNEIDTDGDGQCDFLFYNTHLGNFTGQQLEYMAKDFVADIDAGYQLVCTGDYNLWPWDFEGRYDTSKLTALNGGDDFNYFEESTIQEYGNAIDNIMVSDNMEFFWDEARDCGVIEHQSKASDHSPIYGYIKLK